MAETRMGEGSGDGACGLGEVERRGDGGWEPGVGAGEDRDERGTGEQSPGLLESGLLDGVGGTGENLVDNGTGEGEGWGLWDFFGEAGADTFEGLLLGDATLLEGERKPSRTDLRSGEFWVDFDGLEGWMALLGDKKGEVGVDWREARLGDREGEREWEGDAFASTAWLLLLPPGLQSWGLFGLLVLFGECKGERKLGEEAASVLCSSLVRLWVKCKGGKWVRLPDKAQDSPLPHVEIVPGWSRVLQPPQRSPSYFQLLSLGCSAPICPCRREWFVWKRSQ